MPFPRTVEPVPPAGREVDVVFRIEGVTKVYLQGEVEVDALRGVDLELNRSDFVVLLGQSGSGKSTLLNIMGRLDIPGGAILRRKESGTRSSAA